MRSRGNASGGVDLLKKGTSAASVHKDQIETGVFLKKIRKNKIKAKNTPTIKAKVVGMGCVRCVLTRIGK